MTMETRSMMVELGARDDEKEDQLEKLKHKASLVRAPSVSMDAALASEIFDHFSSAQTFKSILRSSRHLCDALRLKPCQFPSFYPRLKAKLSSHWKAQAVWAKFDKRAGHKVYKSGRVCAGQRVLVIGAGPCGLRTAIEAQLLGARVVVVEKRDRFSRNNVLHLWPYNIHDLRGLAAKKFCGKFCAGAIDHVSIRQLQCILLKVALLLGVEVYEGVSFDGLREPEGPADQAESVGWRARVTPSDHPVAQFQFNALIGADGKRNTLQGFRRKEFRGKLAIAITVNFINRHSEAESHVEEISGVAFIFNQKFFNDLNDAKGIMLENIVYYRDETHYFVMTAKKQSLLKRGVLIKNEPDTAKLLSNSNINQEALFDYARDAADFATEYKMPHLDFAVNHYGKPDVAMFDFTSMFQAENSVRVVERQGHRLLLGLVGDSLLEPFWPTGTGCARGFFGGLDTCWLLRSLSLGRQTMLEALAERESMFRMLPQTTPENTSKNFGAYTVDPVTRYPTVNKKLVLPIQVAGLIDSDNPQMVEEEIALAQASLNASKHNNAALDTTGIPSLGTRKKRRRDSHVSPDALLNWFRKQLASYECLAVNDMTFSFQDGLALCAIIHRYRPDLVDFQALDPAAWAENCQLAFDVLEQDLGISPVMAGRELASSKNPDKLTMMSYLSQIYEAFRKEIPAVKQKKLMNNSDEDLLDTHLINCPPRPKATATARRSNKHNGHHNNSNDSSGNKSIAHLAAAESSARRARKRRSKEDRLDTVGRPPQAACPAAGAGPASLDDTAAMEVELNGAEDEVPHNKENIRETARMNRSANRKRLQRLMERAEKDASKSKRRSGDKVIMKDIKKDERYKAIEDMFSGKSRRSGHGSSRTAEYRENKKPKDLKRAIGKLDKDDWNIKNIADMIAGQCGNDASGGGGDSSANATAASTAAAAPAPAPEKKVPKWSKAAFQDKFNIMKGKLEKEEDNTSERDSSTSRQTSDIDASLARLQRKLREGSVLETGQRGANKVSEVAEVLRKKSVITTPDYQPKQSESESTSARPKDPKDAKDPTTAMPATTGYNGRGGSETCHFCEKRVYVVERMSAEGRFFHRSCFRCDYCGILLRLGSYVHHREGTFAGKFFCIPHSTENALEKYKFRRKDDELKDLADRRKQLLSRVTAEDDDDDVWQRDSKDGGKERKKSLPLSHKDRLLSRLSREGRGSTPERVEFEASVDLQSEDEKATSLMLDEDEWTDRNFGSSSLVLEENGKLLGENKKDDEVNVNNAKDVSNHHGDTSEDAISDLDTDTDSDDEDDEDEDGEGEAVSRPLTSNEARQLQKEWIKKYDPEALIDDDDEEVSKYENAPKKRAGNLKPSRRRGRRNLSPSDDETSDTESNDSEDEESSDDYDGEYESVSTSSDDEDEDEESSRKEVGRIRTTVASRGGKTKKRTVARNNRIVADDNEGTSTEVGSEDLSSDEDTDDDDTSDLGSDFSSGTATECEFTDSEGRPNPFHKQLEVPDIVVEPGSPAVQLRRPYKRGTVLDLQNLPERPAAPAQKMLVTSNDGGGGMSSMTYDSRLQYKTPNVTGRVQTEKTKDQSLVQDFSTRRALNSKKNWMSDAADAKKAAGTSNPPSKKNSEAALAEIDNRLKSLMDRLSSQQSLLKPAAKPSTEMQYFLDSTNNSSQSQQQQTSNSMASSASTSALLESSSSALTSPTTVMSPPITATTAFLRSPPAASTTSTSQNNNLFGANGNPRFMNGAMPKAYRSMSSEQQKSEKASDNHHKSFEEVESIAVPDLLLPPEDKGAKITSGSSDYETDEDDNVEVKVKDDTKAEDVGPTEADKISNVALSVAAAPINESSSFGDEFESCNEGDESADAVANAVEAVNPSLLLLNNESKNEESIFATPDLDQLQEGQPPPPDQPPPPPLATSSPYASMEQQFDFIDEGEDRSESTAAEVPQQPERQKPKPLLFGDAESTSILREKDHKERLAKYTNFREKEKSVVADLILNNGVGASGGPGGGMGRRSNGYNRSSSAVTRSRRVLPQSGPPPPPPNEEAATTPIRRPPPPKRQESAPTATAKSSGALDNEGDSSVQLRKNARNKLSNSTTSSPLKRLPATPLTDPEKFGIRRNTVSNSTSKYPSRPSRLDTNRPTSLNNTPSPSKGSNANNSPKAAVSSSLSDQSLNLTSPAHSTASNDLDYMDGSISGSNSMESSPSKSAASSSGASGGGKKKTFMKTISGIFNRSSSLSSVARSSQLGGGAAGAHSIQQQPDVVAEASQGHGQQQGGPSVRFPRLGGFNRSSSMHREAAAAKKSSPAGSSSPPNGKAPKAEISELGSLGSLASNSTTSTPLKVRGHGHGLAGAFGVGMAAGSMFQTASLTLQASHPSTPPVPLSRKITIGPSSTPRSAGSALKSGSEGSLNSENEENESPTEEDDGEEEEEEDSSFRRREREKIKIRKMSTKQGSVVPPEILEKLLRRGGKAGKRAARVAQLKRVRKAQEIQRQLEELDVSHKELEESGVRAEKMLRGESKTSSAATEMSEADLMRTWFALLSEKNRLVRREQELLVQAKQLELEDAGARLEAELREYLALDSRSPESVVREGEVLRELLEMSEKREKLGAMLERDRARYQREDEDIEAQMKAKGINVDVGVTSTSTSSAAADILKIA